MTRHITQITSKVAGWLGHVQVSSIGGSLQKYKLCCPRFVENAWWSYAYLVKSQPPSYSWLPYTPFPLKVGGARAVIYCNISTSSMGLWQSKQWLPTVSGQISRCLERSPQQASVKWYWFGQVMKGVSSVGHSVMLGGNIQKDIKQYIYMCGSNVSVKFFVVRLGKYKDHGTRQRNELIYTPTNCSSCRWLSAKHPENETNIDPQVPSSPQMCSQSRE